MRSTAIRQSPRVQLPLRTCSPKHHAPAALNIPKSCKVQRGLHTRRSNFSTRKVATDLCKCAFLMKAPGTVFGTFRVAGCMTSAAKRSQKGMVNEAEGCIGFHRGLIIQLMQYEPFRRSCPKSLHCSCRRCANSHWKSLHAIGIDQNWKLGFWLQRLSDPR